jgi:hypothetical protein
MNVAARLFPSVYDCRILVGGRVKLTLLALQDQEKKAYEAYMQAKVVRDTLQTEANEELPAGIAELETAKLVRY